MLSQQVRGRCTGGEQKVHRRCTGGGGDKCIKVKCVGGAREVVGISAWYFREVRTR